MYGLSLSATGHESRKANYTLLNTYYSIRLVGNMSCTVYPQGVYCFSMQVEIKKSITNRLRRIEGQVRGLQKMVGDEQYCVDIITQSSAVRSALSAVEDLMLENHLSEHVIHQMKQGQEAKAVGEIVSIFKKAKKK